MKMMHGLIGALALAAPMGFAFSTPAAAAELPPYVYEQARERAQSVLVIAVSHVERLPRGVLQGGCVITGVVEAVERGAAHTVGQTVSVSVPCIDDDWEPRAGPFPGYDENRLERVKSARIWLTGAALALRGLDSLE